MTATTTTDVQELLAFLIDGAEGQGEETPYVTTYEDAGILTRDAGLVLQYADGSEFQITIKRSR